MDGQALVYWIRYMAEIVLSGDVNNAWIVELPAASIDDIFAAAKWISAWLGW